MTEEAAEYWNGKEGKKQITIEEWLSKADAEIREKPIIRTLNDNSKPVSPEVERESLFLLTKRLRSFNVMNNGEGLALHLNGQAQPQPTEAMRPAWRSSARVSPGPWVHC